MKKLMLCIIEEFRSVFIFSNFNEMPILRRKKNRAALEKLPSSFLWNFMIKNCFCASLLGYVIAMEILPSIIID